MRIVPLEIGRLRSDRRAIDGGDGWATLPIPSWLIEHADGVALFDTGMHVDLRHGTDRIGAAAAIFEPDLPEGEDLTARLTARGVDPADVDLVVLSHLHFDHCGGTIELPDARVVVQRHEWEAGQRTDLIERSIYNPDDFDVGHDVELVDGEHDVFGDGRLVCIPTPGHTKGHQSLRVELDSGPVVLTADCVYFEHFLDDMTVPRFGDDLDRQRESMRMLAALRAEGCRLLFGHDEAQFASLPTAGLT